MMGRKSRMGALQFFSYFSERRVDALLRDNIQAKLKLTTFTTPTVGGILPTVGVSNVPTDGAKPNRAELRKRFLDQIGPAMLNPNELVGVPTSNGQQNEPSTSIRNITQADRRVFARGYGTVEFMELKDGGDPDSIIAYSEFVDTTLLHNRIGVCLFGSKDNLQGFVHKTKDSGWYSSNAQSVRKMIESYYSETPRTEPPLYQNRLNEEFIYGGLHAFATDVANIARNQGGDRGTRVWARGHLFGEARNAEWVAEIFEVVDFKRLGAGREEGLDALVIGAPCWICTNDSSGAIDVNDPQMSTEVDRRKAYRSSRSRNDRLWWLRGRS